MIDRALEVAIVVAVGALLYCDLAAAVNVWPFK
jgi:hypothetical protein